MESSCCVWKFRRPPFLAPIRLFRISVEQKSARARILSGSNKEKGIRIRRRVLGWRRRGMEVEKCRWLKPIETIGDQCSVIPLGNGAGLETKSSWHRNSPSASASASSSNPSFCSNDPARGVDRLKSLPTAASVSNTHRFNVCLSPSSSFSSSSSLSSG